MSTPSPDRPRPLVTLLAPGRYAICACGKTGKAPFCDGSHAGSDLRPVMHTVDDLPMNLAWCTCGTSKSLPRCDGSHIALWPESGPASRTAPEAEA